MFKNLSSKLSSKTTEQQMEIQPEEEPLNSPREGDEVKSTDDDDESWTEVQSLVSLESLGDLISGEPSNRNPPTMEDSISEGSEAAEPVLQETQKDTKISPNTSLESPKADPKPTKKQPRWMSFVMCWIKKIKLTLSVIKKLPERMKKNGELRKKWKRVLEWLRSDEIWPLFRDGMVLCSVAIGVGIYLQK